MVLMQGRGSSQQWPGLGGEDGGTGPLGMLRAALLLISLPWGPEGQPAAASALLGSHCAADWGPLLEHWRWLCDGV